MLLSKHNLTAPTIPKPKPTLEPHYSDCSTASKVPLISSPLESSTGRGLDDRTLPQSAVAGAFMHYEVLILHRLTAKSKTSEAFVHARPVNQAFCNRGQALSLHRHDRRRLAIGSI